jgi:hypothetical protein
VVVVTAVVVMAKEGETVAPAATVTDAGTVAPALLLVSVTTAPPDGAAALSVTVPLVDVPPTTEDGDKVTAEIAAPAGVTVKVAVWVPLYIAEIFTGVLTVTAVVVIL